MEISARLNRNTKVTKISAYRRKKLIQRHTLKVTLIGMIAMLTFTAIYFGKDKTVSPEDHITVQNEYLYLSPYIFK